MLVLFQENNKNVSICNKIATLLQKYLIVVILIRVHYPDSITFVHSCFELQQSSGFDLLVATNWQYISEMRYASCILINPLTETTTAVSVTISEAKLRTLISTLEKRYLSQISYRVGHFDKPIDKLVTEYESWEDLSEQWFVRNGKNTTRTCIPLLFDNPTYNRNGALTDHLYVTVFMTNVQEFFKLAVLNFDKSQFTPIKKELKNLIKQNYGIRTIHS